MQKTDGTPHAKVVEIEVLRAIAILFTLFHHAAFYLLPGNNYLKRNFYGSFTFWGGVDLFFVISGFVIMKSLSSSLKRYSGSLGYWRVFAAFWIRRIFRILPSAWLWLAIFLICTYFFNTIGVLGDFQTNLKEATAGFFQFANYHGYQCAQRLASCGPNGIYWSLSLEEQFYFLLPLTILCFRKYFPIALIIILIPQLFIERYEWSLAWAFRFDTLIWGVLLSVFSETKYFEHLKPNFLKNGFFSFPLLLVLIFLMAYLPQYSNRIPLATSLLGIVCLVLVFIASYDQGLLMAPGKFKKILLWFGSRSFSLYLIHILTFRISYEIIHQISPTGYQITETDVPWVCLLAFSILLVLSELNYRFIEVPTRNFGISLSRKLLGTKFN